MKILLVKMSSLGDIIHAFPAISDAAERFPGLEIDWVVEESFVEMPKWHPSVRQVIPISLRRWRKNLKQALQQREIQSFLKQLRKTTYDYIIDAQGLLKSALVVKAASGNIRCGFDAKSARESAASLFYQKRFRVDPFQHAVSYIRELFAKSLGYPIPNSEANFGLNLRQINEKTPWIKQGKYWVFLHGTSNANKEWPTAEWIKLAGLAVEKGYKVYLPWGNHAEQARAQQIAASHANIDVLPKLTINQMAQVLSYADAVVGLDTGFSHLAAALRVPTLSLYRASDPRRVCIIGAQQAYLEVLHESSCKNRLHAKMGIYDACACFENLEAAQVFSKIIDLSNS